MKIREKLGTNIYREYCIITEKYSLELSWDRQHRIKMNLKEEADIAVEVEENSKCIDFGPSTELNTTTSISGLLTQIAACSYDRAKEIAELELESISYM